MICDTVEELTPIIGTTGVPRAGSSTGDDLPAPAASRAEAAQAEADTGPGADRR
jgi:hypothetical protein